MRRFAPQTFALLLGACGAAPAVVPARSAPAQKAEPRRATPRERDAPVEIVLERPLPVGLVLQHDIHAELRDATVTKRNGELIEQHTDFLRVRFVADGKVVAADPAGRVSALEYVVHEFAELGPTSSRPLVPSGSVIRIFFRDGGESIAVDDAPASYAVKRAMQSFIDGVRAPFLEQSVFGTTFPRRAGQSWSIDAGSLASLLNRTERVTAASSDMAGQVTFSGIERRAGIDCARIATNFRVPVGAIEKLPKSSTLEEAEVVGSASALVPLDRAAPPLGSTVTLASAARVRLATEKGPATVETLRVRFQDMSFRPTPAALVGKVAPELDAPLLYSGARPSIESYGGAPLLLVFWSRDCKECDAALRAANRWASSGRPALAVFVPADGAAEATEDARRLVVAGRIDVPVALGTPDLARRYSALALPATVIIDSTKRIAAARVGVLDEAEFDRIVTNVTVKP